MVEPNNTYNNDKDYEKDLNSFLESDFTVEDIYNADGDDDDFYNADGEEEDDIYNGENDVEENEEGEEGDESEGEDDYIFDMDFSKFNGDDFKSSLSGVNREFGSKKSSSRLKNVTASGRKVIVEGKLIVYCLLKII